MFYSSNTVRTSMLGLRIKVNERSFSALIKTALIRVITLQVKKSLKIQNIAELASNYKASLAS
jgi:hypothetical protein